MVPLQVLQIQEQLVFTMLANFYHCGFFKHTFCNPLELHAFSGSDIFSTLDVLCWHFSHLHTWYKTHGYTEVWQHVTGLCCKSCGKKSEAFCFCVLQALKKLRWERGQEYVVLQALLTKGLPVIFGSSLDLCKWWWIMNTQCYMAQPL